MKAERRRQDAEWKGGGDEPAPTKLAYRVDEPQFGFYRNDGTDGPRSEQKRTGPFRDVTLWQPKPLPAGTPTTVPLD